jgi:hypothetical protein
MCDPYNDHQTAEDIDYRGAQNSNLFQFNVNLNVNTVRHHLISMALENDMNNLERMAKWKKKHFPAWHR